MDSFDLKNTLSQLCSATGVSGCEKNVSQLCAELLKRYTDKVKIDAFNNVTAEIGEFDPGKPTLLLDAHLDEIGFVVSYITDDGFIKVSACGGIDERILPASQVTVYGRQKLVGVFTSVPPHLQKDHSKAAQLSDLYIDLGMSGEQVKDMVSLGDIALIENTPEAMNSLFTSKAVDDRAGVAVILNTLEELSDKNTAFNIQVLFSSKEEVGSQGATTAAFLMNVDYSIAVDVSFGKTFGESSENIGIMGDGAMIGFSSVLSRELSKALVDTAKEASISYQLEVMPGRTGTNSDVISTSGAGSAACTLSIPIRNMHTPVECVDIADIENTARLLAAFCERGL